MMNDELFNVMHCIDCRSEVQVTDLYVSPLSQAILLFGVCMPCKLMNKNSKLLGVVPVSKEFCQMMIQMGVPIFDLEVKK